MEMGFLGNAVDHWIHIGSLEFHHAGGRLLMSFPYPLPSLPSRLHCDDFRFICHLSLSDQLWLLSVCVSGCRRRAVLKVDAKWRVADKGRHTPIISSIDEQNVYVDSLGIPVFAPRLNYPPTRFISVN